MGTEGGALRHIYWIGGSSCSGKSSCAKTLAGRHAMTLYQTDEHAFGEHMFNLENEREFPAILGYRGMILRGIDDFAVRKTGVSLAAFMAYCREVFGLILKDLMALPENPPVMVEGAHLLPELVFQHAAKEKVVFLTSARKFQREIWLKEMHSEIPGGHPGEMESFQKSRKKRLIEKRHVDFHHAIASHIRKTALRCNLPVITVSGSTPETEVLTFIEEYFSLGGSNKEETAFDD
jgi:2-phosphoglycerate kinase